MAGTSFRRISFDVDHLIMLGASRVVCAVAVRILGSFMPFLMRPEPFHSEALVIGRSRQTPPIDGAGSGRTDAVGRLRSRAGTRREAFNTNTSEIGRSADSIGPSCVNRCG